MEGLIYEEAYSRNSKNALKAALGMMIKIAFAFLKAALGMMIKIAFAFTGF